MMSGSEENQTNNFLRACKWKHLQTFALSVMRARDDWKLPKKKSVRLSSLLPFRLVARARTSAENDGGN